MLAPIPLLNNDHPINVAIDYTPHEGEGGCSAPASAALTLNRTDHNEFCNLPPAEPGVEPTPEPGGKPGEWTVVLQSYGCVECRGLVLFLAWEGGPCRVVRCDAADHLSIQNDRICGTIETGIIDETTGKLCGTAVVVVS